MSVLAEKRAVSFVMGCATVAYVAGQQFLYVGAPVPAQEVPSIVLGVQASTSTISMVSFNPMTFGAPPKPVPLPLVGATQGSDI